MAERIRVRRETLELTTYELARRAGVERQYIAMLEQGKRTNPTITILQKLANALGCSVGYLLGETDTP